MRIQFGNLLVDIGLINLPSVNLIGRKGKDKFDHWFSDMSQPFNMYSYQSSIIKSIVCVGLYPNVAATNDGIIGSALISNKISISDPSVNGRSFWWDGKREVNVHPSSVSFNLKKPRYPFMVFLEKVETSKIFLRDITIVSPYSILLFGGSISVQHQAGIVTIDGWLKITAPAQIAVLFKELRATLDAVLKELIRKPEISTVVKNEVVQSIVQLLLDEEKSH
ncbi:hypothetical protein ZOSMA_32G00330 [Zostera marina]|uniref:Uncharacterized protein n=1 Tax=Zostera marina TaxID=29655 RepID=A0A0K9P8F2_ZOSMR|nr:hypothetical protein ZOSMA_32G00330 [Zostera marina]